MEENYTWHRIFTSEAAAREALPIRHMRQFILNGREICLAHTFAGFFALNDACPHLGHSLSKGTTNYLNEVICPWHSYRFNLSNGRECDYRTRPAETYPVQLRDDGLYIGLPAPADDATDDHSPTN